jgi:hypothetical protein
VDLPERQQTLRATGEWTIEPATNVADLMEDRELELSEELARHSLIYLGVRVDNSKKRAAG